MELNKQQQQAVDLDNNVVLVIAGAGSGKTTVLIEKVRKVITQQGIKPWEVLALTFTNNAAKEIKKRLEKQDVNGANYVKSFTFHGFASYILHRYVKYLDGYRDDFQIIDTQDRLQVIKQIEKRNGVEESKARNIAYNISRAKGDSLFNYEVVNNLDSEYQDYYKDYAKYMKASNLMDFDDLLINLHELLQIEECRQKIQDEFKFILIDEYQDTSLIQDKLVKLLKKDDTKLFIVGDVDQSIYRWRGALIENIMDVENSYDDVSVVKLETNYRSSANILDVANKLIVNNERRYDKNLYTDRPSGKKVIYKEFSNQLLEANYVLQEIKFHQQISPNDTIAVLYRMNRQSKAVEDALIKNNISYQMLAGMKFYERAEVKDMLSYLQLIVNTNNDIAFLRIINTPRRKVGQKTLDNIIALAQENNTSYFQACADNGIAPVFVELINKYKELLEKDFDKFFDALVNEINYKGYLESNHPKETVIEKMDNVSLLKEGIKECLKERTLKEVLQEMSLSSGDDTINSNVILSTVHGVKGLEFDVVFVIGMNQGILPGNIETQHELEEERRVCYVAVTRAKKELILTSFEEDYFKGYLPSMFLEEMGISSDDAFKI